MVMPMIVVLNDKADEPEVPYSGMEKPVSTAKEKMFVHCKVPLKIATT